MRAQLATKPDAGGRTLSRQSFFSTGDPQEGEELLLPYGGGLVPAVVVDGIGGYYRPGFSGYDALCRTGDGRYFLVREVARDSSRLGLRERPRFRLPVGRHWLRIRRVSLRAAMLHVTRGCGYPLRQDLWDALAPMLNPEAKRWLERYTAETGATPAAVVSAAVAYVLETAYDPDNGRTGDHRQGEFWRYVGEKVKEASTK